MSKKSSTTMYAFIYQSLKLCSENAVNFMKTWSPAICYRAGMISVLIYCSLTKERPWAEEHLTSLSKRGVGAFPNVSAFNHKRAPMSRLQRLDALKANNNPNNNVPWSHQQLQSQGLIAQQHSERYHVAVSMVELTSIHAKLPCIQ